MRAGIFSAELAPFFALGMEWTPRNEKGPGGGLADGGIEGVVAAVGAAGAIARADKRRAWAFPAALGYGGNCLQLEL